MSRRTTYFGASSASGIEWTAYWNANGDTNEPYNGLNGTWNAGAYYGAGKDGQAFAFGIGTEDRWITVADDDLLSATDPSGDVPFTLRMWVYFTGFSGIGNFLFCKRDDANGPDTEYHFMIDKNGNWRFNRLSAASIANRIVTYSNSFQQLNQWVCVHVVSNGSKFGVSIYLNGVDQTWKQEEVGSYVAMNNTNSSVVIGALGVDPARNDTKHRGRIDEIGWLKGRALTPSEIASDYNGGAGKFYP